MGATALALIRAARANAAAGELLGSHTRDGKPVNIYHGQRFRLVALKSRADLIGWWAIAVPPLESEAGALRDRARVKVVTLGTLEVLSLSIHSLELMENSEEWLESCVFSNDTFAVAVSAGRGLGVRATRDISRSEIVLTEPPLMLISERESGLLMADSAYRILASRMAGLEAQPDANEDELERCSVAMSKRLADLVFATLSDSKKARWMTLHDAHMDDSNSKSPATIFQTNAISNGRQGVVAMYELLSRINHSCTPNLTKVLSDADDSAKGLQGGESRYDAVLKANFDILRGEEFFLSYTPTDDVKLTEERRATLKRRYNFTCTCERCGPADGEVYDGPTSTDLRKRADELFGHGKIPASCQTYHRALHCWDTPRGRERAKLLCKLAATHILIGDSDAGKRAAARAQDPFHWVWLAPRT